MINYSCPHCGHQTQVDPSYAGKSGPCSKCGQTVTIPMVSQDPRAPVAGAGPSSGGSGGTMFMVIAVILGVVALVGVGAAVCCGIGVYNGVSAIGPAMTSAQGAAKRVQCSNNLKQIALAMHNYHDVNGSLPPAYTVDETGRPMHSWRVLLLPYLEEQALFDEFNLEEPWDSPQNLAAASRMPDVYGCPSDENGGSMTSYVVINEPGGMFDADQTTKFSEVADGLSNTVMVIETTGSGIPWNEPRDLTQSEAPLLSRHANGFNAALADGSVRFLPPQLSRKLFNDMVTREGGEVVELP